ncbi:unnamed protein product [Didymodactylos carnosus]|uniref:Uncharacterized protein n=1 Tax=Didymodactylos carnosus TaxID=1234261 RepID=A0A8S2HYF5_9BILA|nr:unnamed protein product [Didymodactylos carnosus]CAF3696353.1 unnamed protein product [Didymodactylos carnosus]
MQIIAKRPDGKPVQMENVWVNLTMLFENEQQKSMDFIYFCRGGQHYGYHTQEIVLRPVPKCREIGGELTTEMMTANAIESKQRSESTSVISTMIASIDKPSGFYIQLLRTKSIQQHPESLNMD